MSGVPGTLSDSFVRGARERKFLEHDGDIAPVRSRPGIEIDRHTYQVCLLIERIKANHANHRCVNSCLR